eukprot:4541913-Pyramimonas_sp.AAC.1
MAEHSSALFKHHRWSTLMNYRIAFGPEELFDDYAPTTEYKIEPRPKQPVDMLKWARQARNGIWAVCSAYGAEHCDERSEALDYLIRQHEAKPR